MARHNPAAYFTDVRNSTAQTNDIVPFTQFSTDLANGALPNYSFVVPNVNDDAHDGTLQQADSWLQTNIEPLLATPSFQPGGHGLLIVVFDEGTNNTNGGGQVYWTAIGPDVKNGYPDSNFYQHDNTLRMISDGFGITPVGAAATAANMSEIFK